MSATDELRPWWLRRPERLRWELANFADAGLSAEVDYTDGDGPALRTWLTLSDGRDVPVSVTFPFEYPLRDPKVHVATGLVGLPHEAFGQLCLLDNPGAQWHPQRSAAELVAENARRLLEDVLVGAPEVVRAHEEQIPDRASNLYLTDKGSVVLVPDPFWAPPPDGATGGAMMLAGNGDRRLLDWVQHLGEADERLKERMHCKEGVALGRWAALEAAPSGHQYASSMLAHARENVPGILEPFTIKETTRSPEFVAPHISRAGTRPRAVAPRVGVHRTLRPRHRAAGRQANAADPSAHVARAPVASARAHWC